MQLMQSLHSVALLCAHTFRWCQSPRMRLSVASDNDARRRWHHPIRTRGVAWRRRVYL